MNEYPVRRRDASIAVACVLLAAACVTPAVSGAKDRANVAADQANQRWHYEQLLVHGMKTKRLPQDGGSAFVLTPWVANVCEHTVDNFDRYFTPGRRELDPRWRDGRAAVARGQAVLGDAAAVESADTHYAGRAKGHVDTLQRGSDEAWLANDNEGVWSLPDGSVNVLMADGVVRSYTHADLVSRFGVSAFDPAAPLRTYGPRSPLPECRKLDV